MGDESSNEPFLDVADVVILGIVALALAVYFYRQKKEQEKAKMLRAQSSSFIDTSVSSGVGFIEKMEDKEIVIFYGSQTGTAEDFAGRLAREAKQYGFGALVCDPEDYEMETLKELADNKLAMFVMATYGEGEPTDNAQEFFKHFSEETDPTYVSNMNYVMFGLGNKTYEQYNLVAKNLDEKFEQLGAKRLYKLGLGDDDGSLEEDYLAWKEELWIPICEFFGKDPSEIDNSIVRQYELKEFAPGSLPETRIQKGNIGRLPGQGKIQTRPPYDVKNPYMAELVVNRELMKGGDRNCMHLEINIKDTPLSYQSGDHIGIFPTNDPDVVDLVKNSLNIKDLDALFSLEAVDPSSAKKFPFPCPCSYRTALSHYLDLNITCHMNMLQAIADYATDDQEKEKLKSLTIPANKAEYHEYIVNSHRTVWEVLKDFGSCKPPVDLVFELLPRLQARYYSIASSPRAKPDTVDVCAVVLTYTTPTGRFVKGVATNWLASMTNPELNPVRLPVYIRKSNFKLPTNLMKPVVMVGPGTGLAPFMGFIQERAAKRKDGKEVGPNLLFFGCRKSDEDFLYGDELLEFEKNGDLELVTAFSREQKEKVYVQHRMREHKGKIWQYLFDQNGHFYVCGDARNMARDVHKVLHEIAMEIGGKSDADATTWIKSLKTSNRYLEDVWS
eukprot:Lithocolla_globosa_v1_NODE_344_length_4393_cov_24.392577.p1 type:complete len:670 gc:universal NODE_344_length_4393_cov_24.392577:2367-4376(+)